MSTSIPKDLVDQWMRIWRSRAPKWLGEEYEATASWWWDLIWAMESDTEKSWSKFNRWWGLTCLLMRRKGKGGRSLRCLGEWGGGSPEQVSPTAHAIALPFWPFNLAPPIPRFTFIYCSHLLDRSCLILLTIFLHHYCQLN